tara:strand:+ start:346 stop:702 length:357 start_codon:yes stop_codon:yes gene_type:complete
MNEAYFFYLIYFVYFLGVFFPWLYIFIDKTFTEEYFENSFLRSWNIIYIIVAFLVFLGGQVDRLVVTLNYGSIGGGIGYFVGTILGVIILSLVLTYIFVLIKIPLKKIHQITNKRSDE